jgi:hypothetical protein
MRRFQATLLLLLLTLPMTGCELIGNLLEFGFWMILILIAFFAAIVWAIRRAFGRRNPPPPGV